MQLRANAALVMGMMAVNLWTEEELPSGGPLVINAIRHDYVEIPESLAGLSETEQCLEALRWAVATAIRERSTRHLQPGS